MNRALALATTGVGIVAILGLIMVLIATNASAVGGGSSIGAGGGHSCALTSSGEMKCWGANGSGQLGNGENTDESLPVDALTCEALPAVVSPAGAKCGVLTDLDSLSTGFTHTCATHQSGIALCWGKNAFGQLGDGSTTDSITAVPVCGGASAGVSGMASSCCPVTPAPTATATQTGTPAATPTGTATPTPTPTPPPAPCDALADVLAISAGTSHTCALLDDSTVWCWGENAFGQLGDGTEVNSLLPVRVCAGTVAPCAPLTGVVAIDAGNHHNCALLNDASVRCWGNNSSGQLGNGTNTDNALPVKVCSNVASAGAGVGGTTCGQLSQAASITAGGAHSCAATTSASLFCWGENSSGQVGDGTSFDRNAPVATCGTPAETGPAGLSGCCVVLPGGTTAGTQPCSLQEVASVAAGNEHTCAVLRDTGELLCWGSNNSGQLGQGSVADSSLPVAVCGPQSSAAGATACVPFGTVAMVAAGYEHTCALTETGGVFCWGRNGDGKLGDGTTVRRTAPVEVTGFQGKPTPTRTPTSANTQTPLSTPQATLSATPTQTSQATPTSTQANNPTNTQTPTRTTAPIATSTPTRTPTPSSQTNGDVDCDGQISAVDAALILQLIAALVDSVPCPDSIDANKDGTIDPIDAALILQYVAGLIPSL